MLLYQHHRTLFWVFSKLISALNILFAFWLHNAIWNLNTTKHFIYFLLNQWQIWLLTQERNNWWGNFIKYIIIISPGMNFMLRSSAPWSFNFKHCIIYWKNTFPLIHDQNWAQTCSSALNKIVWSDISLVLVGRL